jgi:hypothetical protein
VVIRDPMIGTQPPDRALDQSTPGRGSLCAGLLDEADAGLTNRDGFSDMLAPAVWMPVEIRGVS